MLNALWLGFFLTATVAALAQWLLAGNAQVFAAMVQALFAMAKLSVEVMVLLFGTLTLWLGFCALLKRLALCKPWPAGWHLCLPSSCLKYPVATRPWG